MTERITFEGVKALRRHNGSETIRAKSVPRAVAPLGKAVKSPDGSHWKLKVRPEFTVETGADGHTISNESGTQARIHLWGTLERKRKRTVRS